MENTEQMIITWLDILKLCIPFFGPLFIFWFKTYLSNKQKKRLKQECLWRVIKQESSSLVGSIESLNFLIDAVQNDKVRIQAFNIPKIHSDFVRELIDLDPENSYAYARYISLSDSCRSGLELLNYFRKEFVCAKDDMSSDRLKTATIEQITVLQIDVMRLAESEMSIIKIIARENISYIEKIRNYISANSFIETMIQKIINCGKMSMDYRQGDEERMEQNMKNAKERMQSK